MDGSEENLVVVLHERFGAVSVVCVEIADADTTNASCRGVQRGQCHVSEIAKSHRLIAQGMMSWRSH